MNKNPKKKLMTQKRFFEENGFLVLPQFFGDDTIDAVQTVVDLIKDKRPLDVVVDDLVTGERSVLGLLSPEIIKRGRMKINDLYLQQPAIRTLALAKDLVDILRTLSGFTPALCNSLYFEKGSAQGLHIDSLYMTPRTPLHLIATWVALEDTHKDAGQLEYFPGSHLIEPMRFSSGNYHANENEMPAWRDYIDSAITQAKLKKQTFSAKKGDVFIWHSNLLHAGGAINNDSMTRKSCVFHYFSEQDAKMGGYVMVPEAGAFWLNRAPQALPPEVVSRLPFSEEMYLMRYPDIAAAVKAGNFSSGKEHYDIFGQREGRLPN